MVGPRRKHDAARRVLRDTHRGPPEMGIRRRVLWLEDMSSIYLCVCIYLLSISLYIVRSDLGAPHLESHGVALDVLARDGGVHQDRDACHPNPHRHIQVHQ